MAVVEMGRLRFELRTNRLKAECSTAELATLPRAGVNDPERAVLSSTQEKYHPDEPSSMSFTESMSASNGLPLIAWSGQLLKPNA